MVSALDPRSRGLGSRPRHFTVTVPLSLSLHSRVLMGTGKLPGKPVEMLGVPLQWSSIPSWGGGGEVVILTSCYLETVKASGWINPLTPMI